MRMIRAGRTTPAAAHSYGHAPAGSPGAAAPAGDCRGLALTIARDCAKRGFIRPLAIHTLSMFCGTPRLTIFEQTYDDFYEKLPLTVVLKSQKFKVQAHL